MKSLLIALLGFGFASAHAATYTQAEVLPLFTEQYKDQCDLERGRSLQMDGQTDFVSEGTKYQLFTFVCDVAAYNSTAVYYLASEYSTPKVLAFAIPINEGKVVKGMVGATVIPYGGTLDPKTLTLTSFFKGRGVGDAFTSGTYKFEKGAMVLKKYIVDDTFDAKINPKTIVDYK